MKYDVEKVKNYCQRVMQASGLNENEADIFSQSLVYADLRGIGSHGVSRLNVYSKRVSCGVIDSNTAPVLCSDHGSAITVDGKNAIGALVARQAVDWCIERAGKLGCCCAAVRNGNHFGSAAFYTEYAASKHMICCVSCNSEASVVPTGGTVPMLGTNPISLAIPSRKYDHYVLDMATSTVARGKVVLAKKEGQPIPENWGVDKNGLPTTNPDDILNGGAMLPFGGPKGYGISLMIDLMCSGLAGALNCRETPGFWDDFEHPQNIGYFICVVDPSKFMELDVFLQRVDAILEEFKKCPAAPGASEVMIPGEIEGRKRIQGLNEGIELSDAVIKDLKTVGHQYGIYFDLQC